MYEYDKVTMKKTNNVWECVENAAVQLTLTAEQDMYLKSIGYVFVETSPTDIDIIVNRLDVENLQLAVVNFHNTY